MKQRLSMFMAVMAAAVCLVIEPRAGHAQAFESQAEASQFVSELQSFHNARKDIGAPMLNLIGLMNREFGAYRQAVNNSETIEETKDKYQVPLDEFKKVRAEFDTAIARAEKFASTAQSPEIQALASQYVASLKDGQSRVNLAAVGFMYHDTKAILAEVEGLKSAAISVGDSWRAHAPALLARYQAARKMFPRGAPPEVDDCPYEEGTRTHALHCILGQPMSEGTGN